MKCRCLRCSLQWERKGYWAAGLPIPGKYSECRLYRPGAESSCWSDQSSQCRTWSSLYPRRRINLPRVRYGRTHGRRWIECHIFLLLLLMTRYNHLQIQYQSQKYALYLPNTKCSMLLATHRCGPRRPRYDCPHGHGHEWSFPGRFR